MKINIDTSTKTIEINEIINVQELINQLQELLGDKWSEYSLIPKINYTDMFPVKPWSPYNYPIITYDSTENPNFNPATITCKK